jgi:hypothetical protein
MTRTAYRLDPHRPGRVAEVLEACLRRLVVGFCAKQRRFRLWPWPVWLKGLWRILRKP